MAGPPQHPTDSAALRVGTNGLLGVAPATRVHGAPPGHVRRGARDDGYPVHRRYQAGRRGAAALVVVAGAEMCRSSRSSSRCSRSRSDDPGGHLRAHASWSRTCTRMNSPHQNSAASSRVMTGGAHSMFDALVRALDALRDRARQRSPNPVANSSSSAVNASSVHQHLKWARGSVEETCGHHGPRPTTLEPGTEVGAGTIRSRVNLFHGGWRKKPAGRAATCAWANNSLRRRCACPATPRRPASRGLFQRPSASAPRRPAVARSGPSPPFGFLVGRDLAGEFVPSGLLAPAPVTRRPQGQPPRPGRPQERLPCRRLQLPRREQHLHRRRLHGRLHGRLHHRRLPSSARLHGGRLHALGHRSRLEPGAAAGRADRRGNCRVASPASAEPPPEAAPTFRPPANCRCGQNLVSASMDLPPCVRRT